MKTCPVERRRGWRSTNHSPGRRPRVTARAACSPQCGFSTTAPVISNLGRRSTSQMPQYLPTLPSMGRFQGWSNASITKYSIPRSRATLSQLRTNWA